MAYATEASRKRKAEAAFERKENNRAVLVDTLDKCSRLFGPPHRTHACVLLASQDRFSEPRPPGGEPVTPCVHNGDCVALAKELLQEHGAKVWLLNMAGARKPGGGARKGCNAQEEHLCRCSTLLPQLESACTTDGQSMYPLCQARERGKDFKVLVHKKVTFFKHPVDYQDLAAEERFSVAVLTAAAENVSVSGQSIGPNAPRFIDLLLDVVHMQCN